MRLVLAHRQLIVDPGEADHGNENRRQGEPRRQGAGQPRQPRAPHPRGDIGDAEARADRPAGDAEQHVTVGPVGVRTARDQPDRDNRADRERQRVPGGDAAPRVGGNDTRHDREEHDHHGGRDGGEQLNPEAAAYAEELSDVRDRLLADLPALLRVPRDHQRRHEDGAGDRGHAEPLHKQPGRALRGQTAAGSSGRFRRAVAAHPHRALEEIPQDDEQGPRGDAHRRSGWPRPPAPSAIE